MKRKTLYVAVVSLVSMFAVATGASALVYTVVLDAEDYLVSTDGVITYAGDLLPDQDFLLKRGSDLKWTEFDTPGNSPVDYTKVVYTVNVKLRDLSHFTGGVAGLAVSDVTVEGFGEKTPTVVSATLTINDQPVLLADGGALDASNYITWLFDAVTGTLSARVTLPSLDLTSAQAYNDDDVVSVFVMFKTPMTGLTITGGEVGFPDYQ